MTLAATALVGALLWWGRDRDRPDGRLGDDPVVRVREHDGAWVVEVRDPLPPGILYHLALETPRGEALTATADAQIWHFPVEWNRVVAAASSARLVVEWSDLGGLSVRRAVALK